MAKVFTEHFMGLAERPADKTEGQFDPTVLNGLWLKANFPSYNPKPDPPANKGYPVMQSNWPGWCECSLRATVAKWWEHSPATNVARV